MNLATTHTPYEEEEYGADRTIVAMEEDSHVVFQGVVVMLDCVEKMRSDRDVPISFVIA